MLVRLSRGLDAHHLEPMCEHVDRQLHREYGREGQVQVLPIEIVLAQFNKLETVILRLLPLPGESGILAIA